MKFLLDTNVFIALEPTRLDEVENAGDSELSRLVLSGGHQLYVHPAQQVDIDRDRDEERRKLRTLLLQKYPQLPNPPRLTEALGRQLGVCERGSNDWVDHQLIAALVGDAVDFLVTSDVDIRKKAKRLGLEPRVGTPRETIALLKDLYDRIPSPPPAVESTQAHTLDECDPIFDSLRAHYAPDFDAWFTKCKREHPQAWVIRDEDNALAGLCIVKPEDETVFGLAGKLLKICTFKVSASHNGFRFGELLLKTCFDYAAQNRYECAYVTVFERHGALLALLVDFGFEQTDAQTALGERVFVKRFVPDGTEPADPLRYHLRYGPPAVDTTAAKLYVVPIQPRYHEMLFPEAEGQSRLRFDTGRHPCGNAIRKAYLCNSITRQIQPGDILLFYRSEDAQAVKVVGIAESYVASADANEVARFVGKRTVYTFPEIERLCAEGRETLAILFRQGDILKEPITLSTLLELGVLKGHPQQITSADIKERTWLQGRLTDRCSWR